jgi:cytochrome bd ubiquinol oxidase subunit II
MGFIWFWIVAVMLAAYVVLDGFDLGVGILHPLLGRSESDREIMLKSIGPVWDGNEVWLLAGGGTLYFAFPALYASAFSGFYLALMIVLWLLIMRGASVELRMHIDDRVWRSFFDGLFFFSSSLLAVFFGAALANVIRGVPLRADGYFFLPLWTNWRVGPEPGILDWYTVIGGVVALAALAVHGALYLAVKTEGDLQLRSRAFVLRSWAVLFAITIVSLIATISVRADALTNYYAYPLAFAIPVTVLASLGGMFYFCHRQADRKAFASSCLYLSTMLVGAAVSLYPRLLPSSNDVAHDITVQNALSAPYALRVGLVWWALGMVLAMVYFVVVYRMFRGKVTMDGGGYGH